MRVSASQNKTKKVKFWENEERKWHLLAHGNPDQSVVLIKRGPRSSDCSHCASLEKLSELYLSAPLGRSNEKVYDAPAVGLYPTSKWSSDSRKKLLDGSWSNTLIVWLRFLPPHVLVCWGSLSAASRMKEDGKMAVQTTAARTDTTQKHRGCLIIAHYIILYRKWAPQKLGLPVTVFLRIILCRSQPPGGNHAVLGSSRVWAIHSSKLCRRNLMDFLTADKFNLNISIFGT